MFHAVTTHVCVKLKLAFVGLSHNNFKKFINSLDLVNVTPFMITSCLISCISYIPAKTCCNKILHFLAGNAT